MGVFVNKVKHTLRTGQRVLQLGHNARNIIERLGVLVGVVQKNRQLADRDAAANGDNAPSTPTAAYTSALTKRVQGLVMEEKKVAFTPQLLQIEVDLIKALLGAAFVAEGADKMLVADQLVHQTVSSARVSLCTLNIE